MHNLLIPGPEQIHIVHGDLRANDLNVLGGAKRFFKASFLDEMIHWDLSEDWEAVWEN